jgi:hypothetical protein
MLPANALRHGAVTISHGVSTGQRSRRRLPGLFFARGWQRRFIPRRRVREGLARRFVRGAGRRHAARRAQERPASRRCSPHAKPRSDHPWHPAPLLRGAIRSVRPARPPDAHRQRGHVRSLPHLAKRAAAPWRCQVCRPAFSRTPNTNPPPCSSLPATRSFSAPTAYWKLRIAAASPSAASVWWSSAARTRKPQVRNCLRNSSPRSGTSPTSLRDTMTWPPSCSTWPPIPTPRKRTG